MIKSSPCQLSGDSYSFAARAYHGATQAFGDFHKSERGSFGSGVYLTTDIQCAFGHAQEALESFVAEVDVRLANPYRYRIREPETVDSWGEGLVLKLFEDGQKRVEHAAQADGQWGSEIEAELTRRGYDGVLAIFEDGTQEIVAFSPEAVTILQWLTGEQVSQVIRKNGEGIQRG